MKPRALVRVVAILLVLLFVVPSSALAITYAELAQIVAAATQDTTIVLDSDLYQMYTFDTDAGKYNDDNIVWLEGKNGITITIDGNGHTITGMNILSGIYRILNAVITSEDYFVYIPGGDNHESGYYGFQSLGIQAISFGEGNVIDLTLESTVTIEQSYQAMAPGDTEQYTIPTLDFWAFDNGSVYFKSEAEVPISAELWSTDPNDPWVGFGIEILYALGGEGYTCDFWQDAEGVTHLTLVPGTVQQETEAKEEAPPPPPRPVREVVNRLEGSPYYLFRVYISGASINATLYDDATGEKIAFKQKLLNLGNGNTGIRMRTTALGDPLALGITVKALKYMVARNVTTLFVVNGAERDSDSVTYDTSLLLALAIAAGLEDNVELYLTGPDDDIMIRSADGTLTKL